MDKALVQDNAPAMDKAIAQDNAPAMDKALNQAYFPQAPHLSKGKGKQHTSSCFARINV